MKGEFEILEKDLMGRVGVLKTKHGKIRTPALAPVVNPLKLTVSVKEILTAGFDFLMTNAYILWKKFGVEAPKLGVHRILDTDKPIMTDSGAYQLMSYGSIDVPPEEIVKYQLEIGSDIGVILDVPTKYRTTRSSVLKEVRETIKRARQAVKLFGSEDMLLVGPVQGGRYSDIVSWCAREISSLPFDIYAIGGPTQMMEQYLFDELVDLVMTCKKILPGGRPVHLFGAGNPIMLPLAVAMGTDLFDSASYALYAKDLRYMTENGTIRLERLRVLPCNCPVCTKNTVRDLKNMEGEEVVYNLALHNLYVLKRELLVIEESIHQGRLWELLEEKTRAHPSLMDAVNRFTDYRELVEMFDPVSKGVTSGLFFYGSFSRRRVEVYRHLKRLRERYVVPKVKALLLVPDPGEKPFTRFGGVSKLMNFLEERIGLERVQMTVYSPAFGPIPLELDGTYPLSQYQSSKKLPLVVWRRVLEDLTDFLCDNKESYELVVVLFDDANWGTGFREALLEKLDHLGIQATSIAPESGEPFSMETMMKLEAKLRDLLDVD